MLDYVGRALRPLYMGAVAFTNEDRDDRVTLW